MRLIPRKKKSDPPGEMSFFDHLEELRWRLIKMAIAVVACSIPCWMYWDKIVYYTMTYPLSGIHPQPSVIFTAPVDSFMLSFKIAIFGGIIVASPVIFYQLWKFIAPGLHKNEKKMVLPVVFATTFFFLLGICFSYLVFPYLIKFMSLYGQNTHIVSMFRANDYIAFLIKLTLAFGLVFEMPVLSYIFAKIGLIDAKFLIKHSRIAIVLIFVLAAVLTPPDALSQCIMAAPLLVLFGISILVAFFAAKKEKRA